MFVPAGESAVSGFNVYSILAAAAGAILVLPVTTASTAAACHLAPLGHI